MMLKYIKTNRGSTLIMVMIIITILSILGMALLSLSYMNMRMKRLDQSIKNSFYWSESCIDEAYAITCDIVQRAIEAGNTEVAEQLGELLANQRIELENIDEEAEIQDTEYLNADGSVKQEKVKALFDGWFRLGFNNTIAGSDIYNIISSKANYKTIDSAKDINITVGNTEELDNDGNTGVDSYRFTVQSTYTENNITKRVSARFQITVPDYNAPVAFNTNIIQLTDNILWFKTLAADKNIYVMSNNVDIKGDIYARGEKPADLTNTRAFGGIVIGFNGISGNMNITGNAATDSYLHTNANSSSINVIGNVYCDSLVVQDGISGSHISVNGQVSTKDDLELNGSSSTININGNYYGFSDGSSVIAGHDESSSIVFNSPDLGVNSWLRVTGEAYIGGTVYINTKPDKYQTGESVAFKRSPNYLAYNHSFIDSDRDKLYELGLTEEELVKYLSLYSKFNSSNIIFNYYEPLYVADKFIDPNNETLNVFDKRDYIYLYNLIFPNKIYKGSSIVNGVVHNGVFLPGMVYSAGTYVDNGVLRTKDYLLQYKGKYEDPQKAAYRTQVTHMGDIAETGSIESEADKVYVYERFNFNGANIIPAQHEVNQAKELVLVDNTGEPLEIIGANGIDSLSAMPHRQYNLHDEAYKTLILTKGDVYISGKINFEGTVITTGNIYILDGATGVQAKSFKENLSFIKHKIIENNLMGRFINSNLDTKPFVHESNISVDINGGLYASSNNIVKIISWKKE